MWFALFSRTIWKGLFEMALLNKEQIMEIIPHRDPFLLIDEVIAMEPG